MFSRDLSLKLTRMFIEYLVSNIFSGCSSDYLETRPNCKINRVSEAVRDIFILRLDNSNLFKKFSVLADFQRFPELIWEGFGP